MPQEDASHDHESIKPKVSAVATAAYVLGILSIATLGLTAIPAYVLAHTAKTIIRESHGTLIGTDRVLGAYRSSKVGLVLLAIFILGSILFPTHHHGRRSAYKIQNMSQMRGIGQSFAANSHPNKQWWTGFDGRKFLESSKIKINGTSTPKDPDGSHPSVRLAWLLATGRLEAEDMISPVESDAETVTFSEGDAFFTTNHFSYAMLHIGHANKDLTLKKPAPGRRVAWHNSNSSVSPVISDRNISEDDTEPKSYFQIDEDDTWQGHIQYADTHVEFKHRADLKRTGYGTFTKNVSDADYQDASKLYGAGVRRSDNLFTDDDGGRDAMLIHRLKN